MSYLNAIMYSRVVPMYNDKSEKADEPLFDETLDACNESNFDKFGDFEDDEQVVTIYNR